MIVHGVRHRRPVDRVDLDHTAVRGCRDRIGGRLVLILGKSLIQLIQLVLYLHDRGHHGYLVHLGQLLPRFHRIAIGNIPSLYLHAIRQGHFLRVILGQSARAGQYLRNIRYLSRTIMKRDLCLGCRSISGSQTPGKEDRHNDHNHHNNPNDIRVPPPFRLFPLLVSGSFLRGLPPQFPVLFLQTPLFLAPQVDQQKDAQRVQRGKDNYQNPQDYCALC